MREVLVVTLAYARSPVQTERDGEGSTKATQRWRRVPSFLCGNLRGAFGQPAFFLAENRMSTVAFEKESFLKSLVCLAKRFSSTELKVKT